MSKPLIQYTDYADYPETGHFINMAGNEVYFLNGKYHREDGPAFIDKHGKREWLINDNMHRVDGPAVQRADGTVEWYYNNKRYGFEDYVEAAGWTDEQIVEYKLTHRISL